VRRKLKTADELEVAARIERNQPRAYTRNDIKELERKALGRFWGRPRHKFYGPR
jgi:hypothetical protein